MSIVMAMGRSKTLFSCAKPSSRDGCHESGRNPHRESRAASASWQAPVTPRDEFFAELILDAASAIGNVAVGFAVVSSRVCWALSSNVPVAERNLPMKWLPAVLITVVGLCGCKSSQTPFNTLAPFGASRVPPPSTSVGATGPYYNRTATPQTAAPAQSNATTAPATGPTSRQGTSTFNSSGSSGSWKLAPQTASTGSTAQPPVASSETSAVRPASYAAGADSTTAAAATASASGQLRLSGMPVNDATSGTAESEPAKFVPSGSAIEISQLPKPIAAPAPATAVPVAAGTVVASAQASDRAAPTAVESASTLQWKSRP